MKNDKSCVIFYEMIMKKFGCKSNKSTRKETILKYFTFLLSFKEILEEL